MSEQIHKAMAAIVQDVGAIAKGQYNKGMNYPFRGIDDVMNHLHPLLAKHGVYIRTEVGEIQRSEYETTKKSTMQSTVVTMTYHFTAADGSSVPIQMVGEGSDATDKSSAKAVATAMKYAVLQALCIPLEEMRDSDQDEDQEPRKASAKRAPTSDPSEQEVTREALKHLDLPDGWQKGKCGGAFKIVSEEVGADFSGYTWDEMVAGKGKSPTPAVAGGKRFNALLAVHKLAMTEKDLILALKCEHTGREIRNNTAEGER